ncbi:hypothetical protein [Xanthomonas hortorum]|uniref:Uncharacterized protein n=1 Tax=Xanthomonas hortorum pv. hederae TaxID=453603 RepID=A0A9X4BWC9_9XANT|nr:hypothetical protein [Xanthomonas hortorum]MCE4373669.1 hypothetical protein [Xanthomonas hortorum pv. hederae]MDC8640790.1 hypothetical protein [Xanthomonas hortorum pv. hederae]PPU73212.1 hypothetical protein XhhCFBP4925_22245 [Xanthomonas hortorum pv. hederae]PUE93272.1 hypothetical protein C7T87_23095 [Xanthomonas hortorum pv. hederae]
MYFQFGKPKSLYGLQIPHQEMAQLKRNNQIAVIDDMPFAKAAALRNHKFSIVELGDIRSVDQIAEYPIIICDIRGVGKALDSDLEGAHLIAEMRKDYPDKYLVSYSGAQFDVSYNESLRNADASLAKDTSTEQWVSALETGITKVANPRERWLRLRKTFLDRGVELHQVFKLEQSFITAVEERDATKFKVEGLPPEVRQIAIGFAKIALVQIIKSVAGT